MNGSGRRFFRAIIGMVISSLLVSTVIVSAQATPPPITIGQNTTGTIIDPATPVEYSLSVASPLSVNIQLLAIAPQGFAPSLQVLDPSSAVILDTANPGTQASVQGSANLSSPGTYTIVVRASTSTVGQFLIAVQAGAPLAPPTTLIPGQPVANGVNATTTRQAYSFTGSPTDVQLLNVTSASTSNGPVITLRNADTGETLALATAFMAGADFLIPTGTTNYLLEVTSSGGAPTENFTICLATESGSVTCPSSNGSTGIIPGGQIITLTPTDVAVIPTAVAVIPTFAPPPTVALPPTVAPAAIDPNGPCAVTPTNGTLDNIRSGPGTNFDVIAQLPPSLTAQVIGRLPDNSWLQVNFNGTLGWIATSVAIVGGSCGGVAVVAPPSNSPPEVPTDTPTATLQLIQIPNLATNTPMPTPTLHFIPFQPVGTIHFQLIPTPTPTFHLIPIGTIHPIILTLSCPGAMPSHLEKGGKARLILDGMLIRQSPSTSSPVVDTILGLGSDGYIEADVDDGPVCADGYLWWYLHYENTKYGWSIEGGAGTYHLAPGP